MELAFASPEPMVQYPGQITPSMEQYNRQHMAWNQAVNDPAFDSFYIFFPALIRCVVAFVQQYSNLESKSESVNGIWVYNPKNNLLK